MLYNLLRKEEYPQGEVVDINNLQAIVFYPLRRSATPLLINKARSLAEEIATKVIFKALQVSSMFIFLSPKTNQKAFGYKKASRNKDV